MIRPRSTFVDADTVRLHLLEWDTPPAHKEPYAQESVASLARHDASDNIPLVLLHGLGATSATWRLLADYLCQDYSLYAFDLRGHGQSDKPEQGYDMLSISEDIICGMATLGLGQVALAGHGWGARVALVMAARHPALVSHLILVDCPHVEPRYWPGMTRERFLNEKVPTATSMTRDDYLNILRRDMAAFWSPEIEAIVLTYVESTHDGNVVERLHPEHQRLIREALWEDRALEYYAKLSCPVLLIPAAAQPLPDAEPPERLEHADEFAAAKGQMAAQVARAIQQCQVQWMPETAHDIQLQRPRVLAESITHFLQV